MTGRPIEHVAQRTGIQAEAPHVHAGLWGCGANGSETRVVLLPGLGTDARLFGAQREVLGDCPVVPRWIEPAGDDESVRAVARRMAEGRRRRCGAGPVVRGGASFGGMLALEMARELRPAAVVLIGSARSGGAVSRAYRRFARLLQWTPTWGVRAATVVLSKLASSVDVIDGRSQRVYEAMLWDASPRLVRWAARAIPRWRLRGPVGVPVRHLHGGCDAVLPLAKVTPDVVLPGAGHLPSLTHPREVNRFLRRCVAAAGG